MAIEKLTALNADKDQEALTANTQPSSWWNWGKALAVFTVATGAYAITKTVGSF